jgi:adenosylcobinamide-GDP ribazoletransferase
MGTLQVKGFPAAVSFLTRVRVREAVEGRGDLARSVPWFPVVGAVLGLGAAGAYAAARLALPSLVAATLAVCVAVFLTGAFHEDGLADTADALGGGWSREEALRILKDPTHGTYGVLAIVLSVLLRVGAMATLDGWAALAVLPAAHALSRAAAVGLLGWVSPATEEGLGAAYSASASRRLAWGAGAVGLVIGLGSLGAWVLPAALLVSLGAAGVGRLGVRKMGGVTGDLLGAAQQAGEVLVLLLGAAAISNGWPGLPWWR